MKWPQFLSRSSKPSIGVKTAAQAGQSNNPLDMFSVGGGAQKFLPPPPGTFDVYRRIAAYPTVALALEKIVGVILDTEMGWMQRDKEGDPPEWLELIQSTFAVQMPEILANGLLAVRYGFSPFEKVWEKKDGYLTINRLKPLLVQNTTFLTDGNDVTGLRNKVGNSDAVDLDLTKCFWWTYAGEGEDPYGRSRLENIRKRWSEAEQIIERFAKYLAKVAGIIGQIHYPDGTSKNAAGADWPNQWLAAQIAQDAAAGRWLLIPNKFASFLSGDSGITPAVLEKALASAGKSDWMVSFLDPGGTDFAPGFTTALQYYDALLVRGLFQPERSLLEGHHGTKADAGKHDEMSVMDSSSLVRNFVRYFNRYVVDDVLVLNFGEVARGAVMAEAPPLSEDSGDTQDKTILALLASTNPAVSETAARMIDLAALYDDRDIPIVEDERKTTLADGIDEANAKADAEKVQQQKAQADAAKLAASQNPQQVVQQKPANGIKKLLSARILSLKSIKQAERMLELSGADDGDPHWVTISGEHVFLGADGTIEKGPKGFVGKKPSEIGKITKRHYGHTDPEKPPKSAKGKVAEEPMRPATKSEIAKQSATYVGKDVQRWAEEHNEPQFAKQIGGLAYKDNEPVDVVAGKGGTVETGVEMKTMVENKASKLTMDRYSQVRKVVWEQEHDATFHTVVVDDRAVYNAGGAGVHDESQRSYYYRRGVAGSARVASMQKCDNIGQVKKLMAMPEENLPAGAQRTDGGLMEGKWKATTDDGRKAFRNSKTGEIVRAKK